MGIFVIVFFVIFIAAIISDGNKSNNNLSNFSTNTERDNYNASSQKTNTTIQTPPATSKAEYTNTKKVREDSLKFSDVISQMILHTNDFEEENWTWNDCFQWSIRDQYCVFRTFSREILVLEMYGIWLTWFYNFNIRQELSDIHSKYQGTDLASSRAKIIGEIWQMYDSVTLPYYTQSLMNKYGTPKEHTAPLLNWDLEKVGKLVTRTFQPDGTYEFGSVPGPVHGVWDNHIYF